MVGKLRSFSGCRWIDGLSLEYRVREGVRLFYIMTHYRIAENNSFIPLKIGCSYNAALCNLALGCLFFGAKPLTGRNGVAVFLFCVFA